MSAASTATLYFDANRASYIPAYRKRDYVAPVLAFNTTASARNVSAAWRANGNRPPR